LVGIPYYSVVIADKKTQLKNGWKCIIISYDGVVLRGPWHGGHVLLYNRKFSLPVSLPG
jgi:hypothetical protein